MATGIVYYEEADGTPCYGRIRGNTLYKLWTDESGFYTEISEIDITVTDIPHVSKCYTTYNCNGSWDILP